MEGIRDMSRTTTRRHRRAPLVTVCAAAALALPGLAGCESGGPQPRQTTTPSAVTTYGPASAEITARVHATWDQYAEAVLARDGEAAAALMASTTWPMYEEQRRLALTATEKELRAAPVIEQVFALTLRAKFDVARVRSATPRELFMIGVERGMSREASFSEITLGDVTSDGETATAKQIYLGRKTPNEVLFRLEDGTWKLDLAALALTGEAAVRATAAEAGKSVDELVDFIVEQLVGRAKARALWRPIDPA
jgi:hypothetical protein